MPSLLWAIILLAAALIFAGLEVLLPTMGALGAMAVAAVVASAFMAYDAGGIGGSVAILAVAAVLTPATVWLAFRFLPHTPLGDMILTKTTKSDEIEAEFDKRKKLIGQRGVARSMMLPSGDIRLDQGTFDAVSDGSPIELGQKIVVVALRNNSLVVRALSPDEIAAAERIPTATIARDDVLSQPIDQLGLEPLDFPPARAE